MSAPPRRKVRPGKLELGTDGRSLEVHYESLEVATLPNGQEVVQSSKQGVKRIRFELPEDADLATLAGRIVAACKLLHAGRTAEVEALLEAAAERQAAAAASAADAPQLLHGEPMEARRAVSDIELQLLRQQQQQYLAAAAASATRVLAAAAATARLDRLDAYLEALYEEDLGAKAAAAAAVAHLFKDPRCLGPLMAHTALLQALARLLREDARSSPDLCLALLMVFFALSHLPTAQPLLVQNQVGSLTMELIDLELRRAEYWQQREGVAVADVGAKLRAGEPLAGGEARLAAALARQEPVLYVGLSLLLNMAEADVGIEAKMVKKGLLSVLVALLDRGSPQLLLLAVTFLRRLSLFADNCGPLRQAELVGLLVGLLQPPGSGGGSQAGDGRLLSGMLCLLHNLSFDEGMRQQMVEAGLIARAVELLKSEALDGGGRSGGGPDSSSSQGPPVRQLALGLLYHLSLQDRHRSMFLYTDAPATLHAMLLSAAPPLRASCPELAALLVSLAGSQRMAEEMARAGRLEALLALALGPAEPGTSSTSNSPLAAAQPAGGPSAHDELLWKLLRALAEHDSEPLRARFGPALHRLAGLLMSGALPAPAFFEALGCLARLDIPGFDYAGLLRATGLPAFLARLVAAGGAPGGGGGGTAERDGVLLAVVEAVGVLCADEACAGMLAAAGLVDALHSLMLGRMEEEAFVLATTASAGRLLGQQPSRAALLAHPEVAARFAELLQHPAREVARAADAALDAVGAGSEEWATSVRRLRFETHNAAWLHMVRSLESGDLVGALGEHQQEEEAQEQEGQGEPGIGAFWPPAVAV